MATQGKDQTVRFLRYNGYLDDFNKEIAKGSYNDCIVFALLLDRTDPTTVIKKIYAGKDEVGLDYIYDMCQCDSSKGGGSIVVDDYEAAKEYRDSKKASEGDIITTRDEKKTYVIVTNTEGEKELIEISGSSSRCKWIYGDVTEGWHTDSSVITNPMGMIAENTTLGEFVELTDGEFSRMIEMLLFKPALPVIDSFTVSLGDNKHTDANINISTTNAKHTEIYICTAQSLDTSIAKFDDVTSVNYTELEAGKTYYIIVKAINDNGTTTSSWQSLTTNAYVQPAVSLSKMSYVKNGYDVSINSISSVTLKGGEYNLVEASTTYSIYDNNGTLIEGPTSNIEELKVAELAYNTNYKVVSNYTLLSTDGKSSSTGIVKSPDSSQKSDVSLSVIITDAIGTQYVYTDSLDSSLNLSEIGNTILVAFTPDFDYEIGSVSIAYNGYVKYEMLNAVDGETVIAINSLTLDSSDNAIKLVVTAKDAGNQLKTITIPIYYKKAESKETILNFIAVPLNAKGNPDTAYEPCSTLIDEALLDKDDEYGIYYYGDGYDLIKEEININTIEPTPVEGITYYKYVPNTDIFGNGIYGTLMLISDLTFEIYPGNLTGDAPDTANPYDVEIANNKLNYPTESSDEIQVSYIELEQFTKQFNATCSFWIKIIE